MNTPNDKLTGAVVHPVDYKAIHQVFDSLANDLKTGADSQALAGQYKKDPLTLLAQRGVTGVDTLDAEVKQQLTHQLINNQALPTPAGAEAVVASADFNFGCWACMSATETALSIAIGASLALLVAGGAIAASAIAVVAPLVGAILSISTGAASQLISSILAHTSDPGKLVNDLAAQACKGPCN